MTTYTSQPDETDGLDTFIYGFAPTTNNETAEYMLVGTSATNGNHQRGLLKFDLTKGTNPPPPGSIITPGSGVLTLYCDAYNITKTLAAYECLKNFDEGQATWNIYSTDNNWTTAGASSDGNDYDSTVLGSVSISSTGAKTINLADEIIQKWIDAQNYGLILRNTVESSNSNRFVSSSGANASQRPKLTFEYILLGGQVIWWS